MKLPYGISDFKKLIHNGYFYRDRTDFIPVLEDAGDYLLFIRPRRFGKSLLISTLETYYDVREKERFIEFFGSLAIGASPTPLANGYFILKWDFSCVDPSGTMEDIHHALHDHVNSCIESFLLYYEQFLPRPVHIDEDSCVNSLRSLISITRMTEYPVYLFIDNYDNFANEIMTDPERQDTFQHMMFKKGPLKTLFKSIKALAASNGIDRCFISGISPIVINDIASGYSLAKNVGNHSALNALCGFREDEIADVLSSAIAPALREGETDAGNVLDVVRSWYAGYRFCVESREDVYNPAQVLYFLESYSRSGTCPRHMLDDTLSSDDERLQYIKQIPGGRQTLIDVFHDHHDLAISRFISPFGIRHMFSDMDKDQRFILSLLHYFGALTLDGTNSRGDLQLKMPNLAVRGLYAEHILHSLFPLPDDRDRGIAAAQFLYSDGDMEPLCHFVEQQLLSIYRHANPEEADTRPIATAFFTLLYNDVLYLMNTETSLESAGSGLIMRIRPDMRHYDIYDLLIEFKFLPAHLTGLGEAAVMDMSYEDFIGIPSMQLEMGTAKNRLITFGDQLEQQYPELRLRRFAVIALGCERIWWEEI